MDILNYINSKYLFLLCYYLKLPNVDIDAVDNTNGAKLNLVDAFGNKIAYIRFISGNKFAFRFSQNHDKSFDINQTYLNNGTSLCNLKSHQSIVIYANI